MGISSFGAMGVEDQEDGHWAWNHWLFQVAPHPHVPDASDRILCDGSVAGRNEIPFHDCRRKCTTRLCLPWLLLIGVRGGLVLSLTLTHQ